MLATWKFHHIGIAVFNIDASAAEYVAAGYTKSDTIYDSIQNVYICFLNKEGMPQVELLAPKDETSPVNKTLEKMGVTPYHCCYEVEDLQTAIMELRKQRYIVVSKPAEAVAIGNHKVCFLFNKNIGLIEIVEK